MLIDIPSDRPGSGIALEYLPESNRRDFLQDWSKPVELEDSVIWTNLHKSYLEAVGKVRVFCDPRFRDTIEAGIKKEKLAGILDGAVRKYR